jgi:hypothetical protein
LLFAAASHPEVEYPKRPEKHRITKPADGEIDFEESLSRYAAERLAPGRS